MKWIKNGYGVDLEYIGRKNNFKFYIKLSYHNQNYWYFYATHNKLDIRFNSLWENTAYKSLELAQKACEEFNYKKRQCLGDNING